MAPVQIYVFIGILKYALVLACTMERAEGYVIQGEDECEPTGTPIPNPDCHNCHGLNTPPPHPNLLQPNGSWMKEKD